MTDARNQKILIVDDQEDNLLVLKAILGELDKVDIIAASSGTEALESFERHEFAVAVLDVQMPAMDGYELAAEIRRRRPRHDTPIIFLSAVHTDKRHIAKGYSSGAVDFLTKPVDNDIFLCKVKVFLELDALRRGLSEKLEKQNDELIRSEKMRALGELAGGVAHDFNNQLTAIMGYTDLLRKKLSDADPNILKYLDMIAKSARVSAELTKQLLDFSRKETANLAPLDMRELLNDIASIVKRTFHKSIKIELDDQAESTIVDGNASKLNNAILNICVNARDAMPTGGTLRISARNVSVDQALANEIALEAGDYIEIKISDTGTGMEPEVIERIFEPFFSTKQNGEGTGLGLASVYATVKSHKGNIRVDSVKGEGSAFTILLPLSRFSKPSSDLKSTTTFHKGQGRILLVDDNDWVRNSALSIVEELGYDATGYAKAEKAIDYFRERKNEIDLVMLDMTAPNGTIPEIVEEILKVDPDAKVLLATSEATESLEEFAKSRDGVKILRKPYEGPMLSKIIMEMTSGHQKDTESQ